MTRKQLFSLALGLSTLFLVVSPALWSPSLWSSSVWASSKKRTLNPNRHGQVTDHSGTTWMVNNGQIHANNLGQLAWLMVDNMQPNYQRIESTPDLKYWEFEGHVNGMTVLRRISFERKEGGFRIVDTIENPTANERTFNLVHQHYLHNIYQPKAVTENGAEMTAGFGKKDHGFGVISTRRQTLGMLFLTHAPRATVKPTVQVNNTQFRIMYPIKLKAKASVSIVSAARSLPTGTSIDKGMPKEFAPYRSRGWLRDLDSKLRSRLVNFRSTPGFVAELVSLTEALDVELEPFDQLIVGSDTRLPGTARCSEVSLMTARGKIDVPFEDLAAVVGSRSSHGPQCVYLRDGQRIQGTIEMEKLTFEMNYGTTIRLSASSLDRLVLRAPAAGEAPEPGFLLRSSGGESLVVDIESTETLSVVTRWRTVPVRMADVREVSRRESPLPGVWLRLVDGSRVSAYLESGSLLVESSVFGPLAVPTHDILSLQFRASNEGEGDSFEAGEITEPHLVLRSGDIVVGRVLMDELTFVNAAGEIAVPPLQIEEMTRVGEEYDADGTLQPIGDFQAVLWGGGELRGALRVGAIPISTHAMGVIRIPASEIAELRVPTPVVPEVVRKKVTKLILELGDNAWEVREQAERDLIAIGALARQPLERSLQGATDPEIERRIRRVLEEIN